MRSLAVGAVAIYPVEVPAVPPSTVESCRRRASDLALAMAEVSGGQWRVSVDEKMEFILISRVL
jgi:hypothetical protein